jgi:hypothetical protein
MKTINDKALTALVRSMKKALATQHGIVVPSSALRASYLQAVGENPHAYAKQKPEVSPSPLPAPPKAAMPATVSCSLYLAEDDIGCLVELALDAQGTHRLRENYPMLGLVTGLFAEVPRINKYGLPDYLANPGPFFHQLGGLEVAKSFTTEVTDLGDDSGDTCRLTVEMLLPEWLALTWAVFEADAALRELVCEWVGLHYLKNFTTESREQQGDFVVRYLAAQDPLNSESL